MDKDGCFSGLKKRTQIAFDVQEDLRSRIKVVAARRNISMNLWLIRAIYEALRKEDRADTLPSDTRER